MALDLLERYCTYPNHVGAYLLRHPLAAYAKSNRGAAKTDVARFFLYGPGVCAIGCRTGSGAAAELDELRNDHCIGCHRTVSAAGRPGSLPDASPSADQPQVPHAAQHPVARGGCRVLRFLDAGDGCFDPKLSWICQRLSPATGGPRNALGRLASGHLRAICDVSA